MKTWILLFCLFLGSCSNRQTQSSDHENFYRIDFRPLVKNEAQEIGLNELGDKSSIRATGNQRLHSGQIHPKDHTGRWKLLVVHSDRLSLFDKDGKYMYEIGKKGDGEGEYKRMNGVILRNDTLFVVDGNYDFTRYNLARRII